MHDLLRRNKYNRRGIYAGKALFIHACAFVMCNPATPFMQSSNNAAQISSSYCMQDIKMFGNTMYLPFD